MKLAFSWSENDKNSTKGDFCEFITTCIHIFLDILLVLQHLLQSPNRPEGQPEKLEMF